MTEIKYKYHDQMGVRRTMIADDENPDEFRTFTEVDLDGILESIKRDRELQPAKSDNKLVARVPMTIMEQSIHEQWTEADWKVWLNDPANEPFRIWRGRV